jgi:hypothetical protein
MTDHTALFVKRQRRPDRGSLGPRRIDDAREVAGWIPGNVVWRGST